MNRSEYAWMYVNKQNSEYASGPKYPEILNMEESWTLQSSQYSNVTQRSEYAREYLDKALDISGVPSLPGFWILQGSTYAVVTHGSKYATMWLNLPK